MVLESTGQQGVLHQADVNALPVLEEQEDSNDYTQREFRSIRNKRVNGLKVG